MKIVVTGSIGHIGSYILQNINKRPYNYTAFFKFNKI